MMNPDFDKRVNRHLDRMKLLKDKGLHNTATSRMLPYDRLMDEFMDMTDTNRAMESLSDETLARIAAGDY